jgi:hypothetical protein
MLWKVAAQTMLPQQYDPGGPDLIYQGHKVGKIVVPGVHSADGNAVGIQPPDFLSFTGTFGTIDTSETYREKTGLRN